MRHTQTSDPKARDRSHMPTDSVFYEKIIPVLLIVMAVLTVAFVLFAAGVLLGFIPFT